MKTLIVTRHGKSEIGLVDILRKLDDNRSTKDIKKVTSDLVKNQIVPDFIISSSSVRTVETSKKIIENFNKEIPILTLESLYLKIPDNIFSIIEEHCSDHNIVMIVGHNPSLEIFI